MKPKVLHIITRMDAGGSAVNTAFQIKETADRYDNSLVCGSLSGLPEEDVAELRGACGLFAVEPWLRRDPHPVYDLLVLPKLCGIIRRGGYDIVSTHTSKAGFLGRIAARLAGARRVMHHTHGHVFSGYFSRAKSLVFMYMEKFAARFSDMIVCLTDIEVEDHLKLGIGKREQFRSLPSGVPVEKYSSAGKPRDVLLKSIGVPEGSFVLGVVARLEHVKGVRHAVEMMGALRDDVPEAHLVVVGEGAEREMLEGMSRELGVGDRVHFIGQRDDVPDVLHAMDVFVSPSLYEGYGRVIVEAMCAGLPVVASRTSGAETLVREGVTGVLAPIGDGGALAAAVAGLARDADKRRGMSEAAKRCVSEELSNRAAARRLEGFYEELLAAKATSAK